MTEAQLQIDLIPLIPQWLREADAFEEQALILSGKARALRQMVESVQILNGDAGRLLSFVPAPEVTKVETTGDAASSAPAFEVKRTNRFDPSDGPRGRDAVRLIVRERPGLWSLREIRKASALRGWPSPANGLNTAVHRLVETGEAEYVRKGVYRFPPQGSELSTPVTGDGSEGGS